MKMKCKACGGETDVYILLGEDYHCVACHQRGIAWAVRMAYLEENLPAQVGEERPAPSVVCERCNGKGYVIKGTMVYACRYCTEEKKVIHAPFDPRNLEAGVYIVTWKSSEKRDRCFGMVGKDSASPWLCTNYGFGGLWSAVEKLEVVILNKDIPR